MQYGSRSVVLGVLVGILLIVAALAGCASWTEVEQVRARAEAYRDELAAQRHAAEAALADAQRAGRADSPDAQELARLRDRLAAQHDLADAAAREIDLLLARARGQAKDDPVGQTIGTITPWLPTPLAVPVGLGAAAILGLARAAQLKKAALSIAQGLDKAMARDPDFKSRFHAHADLFRVVQTPTARRLVDESQRRRSGLVRNPA